jgi:hypothetical protein
MGKWINRVKEKDSEHILNQSDRVDIPGNKSTLSTMSPHTSYIVKKKSRIDACKISELKSLMKKISVYYGGDDDNFLEGYINDVINEWSHDLDTALVCFRDISVQRIK